MDLCDAFVTGSVMEVSWSREPRAISPFQRNLDYRSRSIQIVAGTKLAGEVLCTSSQ